MTANDAGLGPRRLSRRKKRKEKKKRPVTITFFGHFNPFTATTCKMFGLKRAHIHA